ILDLFLESVHDAETPRAVPNPSPTLGMPEPDADAGDAVVLSLGAAHSKRARDAEPVLDPGRLRAACADALAALEEAGDGREAIDFAIARLTRGWEGRLIASVYLVEHDRLWVASQRGYAD